MLFSAGGSRAHMVQTCPGYGAPGGADTGLIKRLVQIKEEVEDSVTIREATLSVRCKGAYSAQSLSRV